MARVPCLLITREFRERHVALLEFLHATSAALWNTRWQVRGYVAAMPDATRDDLEARFVQGSGIYGANVIRSFVEGSWEQDQQELARLALTNVLALFEGWTYDVAAQFDDEDAERQLQFPSRGYKGRTKNGVRDAVARIHAVGTSPAMSTAFATPLQRDPVFRGGELDELLLLYRYFKECRNCLAHANGGADEKVVKAFESLASTTKATIRATELPQVLEPTLHQPIELSLRGVIGFTGVVFQTVRTLDALLAQTKVAEAEFLARFEARHPSRVTLSSTVADRDPKIRSLAVQAGYPKPGATIDLDTLLTDKGRIWPARPAT